MICSNCQKEISDESKFCRYCGATVNRENASKESEIINESTPGDGINRDKNPDEPHFIIGIIIVALLCAANVALIVYGITRKSESKLPVIYANGNVYPITVEEGIKDWNEGGGVIIDGYSSKIFTSDGQVYINDYYGFMSDYGIANEEDINTWMIDTASFTIIVSPKNDDLFSIFTSNTLMPFDPDEDVQNMDRIWGYFADGDLTSEETEEIIGYYESVGYRSYHNDLMNEDYYTLLGFYTEDGFFDYEDEDYPDSLVARDYLMELLENGECDVLVTCSIGVFHDNISSIDITITTNSLDRLLDWADQWVPSGELSSGIEQYMEDMRSIQAQ